ncbi:methylated-DNA--[protein]-cysteine S-methyltransferase [Sagittula salina]|uniref:Methylated-DNA--[protein]-cysteine S-methyltransferase n=1 Tax=Sagittula salina TaxID=2820268 RepID=A0A940RZR5_9RHOB|nr:methylated-DNA--[protein]-cysteine S-methyltransferase [Sagittula salina]MBP0481401.1 methylated-DNA--[protein]-cysteine S-methyltransferase [Sagittula salina]
MPSFTLDTRNGPFLLEEDGGRLIACGWRMGGMERTPLLDEAARQVQAWYAGRLTRFDLPLEVGASPFQRAACDWMAEIPLGETATYVQMAHALGVSARAAGRGCGGNPLPLIVPCHRVLGSRGLGGFSAGGVETKVFLLRHEGAAGLLI